MKFNKAMLACTTILTMSMTGGITAHAQNAITQGVDGQWAANGTGFDDGTIEEAVSGAPLTIIGDGVTITVKNDGVADDSGGFQPGVFLIGQIDDSSTANDGALLVTSGAGGTTVASVVTSATLDGDVTVENQDVDNAAVIFDADTLTVGGNLAVTNNETDGAFFTVEAGTTSDVTVAGTTTITGGAAAGTDAVLHIGGTSTFTGGVTLDDGAGGQGVIAYDGLAAQTINAGINGATAGEGMVAVTNTAGLDINSAIGATNSIDTLALLGGTATMNAAVNAANIDLTSGAVLNANQTSTKLVAARLTSVAM